MSVVAVTATAHPDAGPHARTPASPLSELLRRLAAGDLAALDDLYRAASRDLHGFALLRTGSAADAADVVQDVFVRLADRVGRLPEVRHPRAYLLTMVHRAAVDLARRRRPAEPLEDDLVDLGEGPPELWMDAAIVARHLTRLPAKQREAVYLRYVAELSFVDIGRVTGVPTFTAASRCRLGVRRLRRAVGEEP